MMLPAEWHAENDDDVIRILDQDDVGEIQVTTLHKESGKVDSGEVSAMARQESPEIGFIEHLNHSVLILTWQSIVDITTNL